jgi:hypothetical protein
MHASCRRREIMTPDKSKTMDAAEKLMLDRLRSFIRSYSLPAMKGRDGYATQRAMEPLMTSEIEDVASGAYDAEGPFDDHGRILVSSEKLARVTRIA